MNKNIIIAGAIAVGLYLFSQTKKVAQRIRPTATPSIRQRTAQKIAQKIGKKVAQKVAPKRIGQPATQAARIAALRRAAAARRAAAQRAAQRAAAARRAAAQKVDISRLPVQLLRYTIAHIPAQMKTGEEVAALKAEVARREAAYIAALRKAAARKAAARKAAARKAAVRKAAAQMIGKKIGKTVAQKIPQILKARRAVIAQHAKRQRPQIQRPNTNKKWAGSKLFPGAEKSGIIPYSESSKHSYYGPKNHKLQNEGYMVEWQKRHYNSIEAYKNRKERYVLSHPEYWKK